MRFARLLTPLLFVVACTGEDDKAPGEWSAGKGDGAFELYEAGPAELTERTRIALDRRVPAYRVESYGGTTLSINLAGHDGADAYLIVEGPLAGDGDRAAIGSGRIVAEDDDSGYGRNAKLEVELGEPGVYRVLAGTFESLGAGEQAAGALSLTVECTAHCERPMVDQKSFIRALQAQGGTAFADYLKGEIAAAIPDPTLAASLTAQLDRILADPELRGLERFPTISLAAIGALRPALGALPAQPSVEDAVVTGDLMQLLGGCTPDRSAPAELDGRVPGVRYGQFPSKTLAPCQFAHARPLAQVLTSLAANNGSAVTYQGQQLRTPRELFGALVASGHSVEVRNERMYANFLSLIAGDRDVIWPVYLDSGLSLSDGTSLTVPMGHSHHAWRISGPQINTRVMFYLGVSGAGFFGQTDARPAWSGTVSSTTVRVEGTSGADYEYLGKTLDAASAYLRRIRVERTTVAQGRPADGYGYLGVCNDSNATLEHATRGTISTFPLMRAEELDAEPALGDGLDGTIRALPKDGDGIADRRDALRRAIAMQPFAPESALLGWDPALAAQLRTAKSDLAR